MDRDLLKGYLDRGLSLEEIGRLESRHPSTIGYWVGRHGLAANGRDTHAARGGIARESLEELVLAGLSQRRIAKALDVSQATVKYWLKRHGLVTLRARERARPGEPKPARITRTCRWHGKTEYVLEGRGAYRCCRCRVEAVTEARRRLKRILVREAGGKCVICGYDRCEAALQFHHLDPEEKEFAISHGGVTRELEALREEVKKCILVCANCHAEIEAGITKVPIQFLSLNPPGIAQAA
jgi:hypothetical protein